MARCRAETAESYHRAGGAVFDLYAGVEQRRSELIEAHADLWELRHVGTRTVSVLRERVRAADVERRILEAGYTADPKTVGFLPR